jgi:hypothetical protein
MKQTLSTDSAHQVHDDAETTIRIAKLQKQLLAFGGARTPLEQEIDKERIIVAGPQIFSIPKEWTFQEFLFRYGQLRLGEDWTIANTHFQSPHPLVAHLIKGCSDVRPTGRRDGSFLEFTMNGDLYAFLSFAYDLFTLADNAAVQQSLLARVRNRDQYHGARYEIFVAASFLRSGFKIAFEDEGDSKTSHCEFTATHKKTGRSFSIEAKGRYRSHDEATLNARMYKLLQRALLKKADHERIIFADVNLPSDNKPVFQQEWHQEVGCTLSELEQKQKAHDPWPQAIVFFTNRKTSAWPSRGGNNSTVLLTAINHPLFKIADRGPVEREYPEIGTLFHATNELSAPPSHFFGQGF